MSKTSEINITREFSDTFDLLENTRQNMFLTGRAGTGKSTFLQYFRTHTKKEMAVVVPTGVAALNVQGQTIHSFFRLKSGFVDIATFRPGKRRVFRALELLVIDEISMVRADLLDAIDQTLRHSRKSNKPFGGVQLCVIGDLFQLPPIVSNEEKAVFADHYPSPFFFHAKAYAVADFQMVQFDTIHRQKDMEFIHILNAIRTGESDEATLAALNARVIPKAVPSPGTLVLTTTNRLAEDLNAAKLTALSGPMRSYMGDIIGTFGLDGARLPAPEELVLKPGAQVMFVKNDADGRWVNGTIGIVEALAEDVITVRADGETHEVEKATWESIAYETDAETDGIVEKILGSYKQFPLMLAWAVTIHKSQGKTLERVIIDLGRGAFAPGQLYVALSRCRTLASIALKQPVRRTDIHCDAEVAAFMREKVGG